MDLPMEIIYGADALSYLHPRSPTHHHYYVFEKSATATMKTCPPGSPEASCERSHVSF